MSSVADIERAVEKLSPSELAAFRAWFAERDAEEWVANLKRMCRQAAWMR